MSVPAFASADEARAWMQAWLDAQDEHCVDNRRFAFEDDPEAMHAYQDQQNEGCCGFFDRKVSINGRYALIGCNYGH